MIWAYLCSEMSMKTKHNSMADAASVLLRGYDVTRASLSPVYFFSNGWALDQWALWTTVPYSHTFRITI